MSAGCDISNQEKGLAANTLWLAGRAFLSPQGREGPVRALEPLLAGLPVKANEAHALSWLNAALQVFCLAHELARRRCAGVTCFRPLLSWG